jgi:hypothetical protein
MKVERPASTRSGLFGRHDLSPLVRSRAVGV